MSNKEVILFGNSQLTASHFSFLFCVCFRTLKIVCILRGSVSYMNVHVSCMVSKF